MLRGVSSRWRSWASSSSDARLPTLDSVSTAWGQWLAQQLGQLLGGGSVFQLHQAVAGGTHDHILMTVAGQRRQVQIANLVAIDLRQALQRLGHGVVRRIVQGGVVSSGAGV